MNWIRDNILKLAILLIILIIVIVVVSMFASRGSVDNSVTGTAYGELESKLQSAAIKFVNDNSKYLPENTKESTVIKLETLVKAGYIGDIYAVDDNKTKCSGKVTIYKTSNDGSSYKLYPHISCGKYYTTETIAEHIINQGVVTKDDGLYKEGEYYRFKGEYPNNYILLDGQEYRIISIDSNNVLKLMKTTTSKSKYLWDDRYNTNEGKYVGITTYDKSRMKDNLDYLYSNQSNEDGTSEVLFTPDERSYFIFYDFCNGDLQVGNNNIDLGIECSKIIRQKIGFINASDYYLSSIDSGCSSMNLPQCTNYNYLAAYNDIVLMNLTNRNTYQYLYIDSGIIMRSNANKGKKLYIATHISNENIYKSGSGTKGDPYIIR